MGINEMSEQDVFKLNVNLHKRLTRVLYSAGFEYANGLVFANGTRGKVDLFDDSSEGRYIAGFYWHIGAFDGVLSDHFNHPSEITTRAALRLVGILK